MDAVAGSSGAPGHRGDVDQVAAGAVAGVLQLLQDDLGSSDRPDEVDLDHGPVVRALLGGEWAQQHGAGVVDQNVGTTELVLDPSGGDHGGVAVGDIGFEGDRLRACRTAQFGGQGMEAVEASGQEGDAVAWACPGRPDT